MTYSLKSTLGLESSYLPGALDDSVAALLHAVRAGKEQVQVQRVALPAADLLGAHLIRGERDK